jgi:hypothetical protein
MSDMKEILNVLQTEYEYPVDIEYTINISKNDEYVIDLLQCRPLQMSKDETSVAFPDEDSIEQILIETKGVSMGFSRQFKVDVIVYVDAVAYYEMRYKDKYRVKSALSAINWKLRERGRHMILIVPGRIGTSSPELGVPTEFGEISEFDVIIEVSEKRAGYMPELSYGSHFFQDLVEAGILYSAIFEGNSTLHFHPEFLKEGENELSSYYAEYEPLEDIVYVKKCGGIDLYYDMKDEHLLIAGKR